MSPPPPKELPFSSKIPMTLNLFPLTLINLFKGSSLFVKRLDFNFDPIIPTYWPLSFSDLVKFLPFSILSCVTSTKLWSPASTKTLGFVTSDLYLTSAILVTVVLTVAIPAPSYFFKNSAISLYLIGG